MYLSVSVYSLAVNLYSDTREEESVAPVEPFQRRLELLCPWIQLAIPIAFGGATVVPSGNLRDTNCQVPSATDCCAEADVVPKSTMAQRNHENPRLRFVIRFGSIL